MAFENIKNYIVQGGMDEDVEFMPLLTLEEEDDPTKIKFADEVPVLPLKNTVLFPGVVIPITVGRDKSIKAVKEAYNGDKIIGVIAQKNAGVEEPEQKDLFEKGTLAKIIKMLKMPDGSTTAIIQGKKRFRIEEIISTDPYFKAKIVQLPDIKFNTDPEFLAIVASLKDLAAQLIRMSPNIPTEANIMLKNIDSASFLINFIASNLSVDMTEKQKMLEIDDLKHRSEAVLKHLQAEIQMLELKNKIQNKVRTDIEKQQRDYFLQQQMKTIQEELGGDNVSLEIKDIRVKAAKKKWSKPVAEQFEKEVQKIERMNPAAAEYSVILNYLELLLDLPWDTYTKDKFDLKRAKKILDEDHFGLEKVKDRILEYLAVLKLKGDMKSPILCLVGPPGVGKTSLGKSIAKALKRKYVRMALGGLHDEAEIRGHRKTYIGAMPGRVIQSLRKAKTSNPVFVLDEIDKVGADYKGDPSSALLEVLDPEQNSAFYDQYVELEYDLSKVLFVATANSTASIQPALRDRMETIEISGYSTEEKIEIAKKHLIPKELEVHGLKPKHIQFDDTTLRKIIEDYTRESGVRDLERKIASVMRHIAKNVAMNETYDTKLSIQDIEIMLGKQQFDNEIYKEENPAGVAVGLAWTSVGGEILYVETAKSKGKGNLKLTGNLGDVMKESASTALSFLKSHADELNLKTEDFEKTDIHVHVPEGAVPKDGPSAGVTMLSSIASSLTGKKVKPFLAMTGEITLRGKVLPVGGIKEKILAAQRSGMKEVLLCKQNEKDIKEIKSEYIRHIKFHYVDTMQEVLDYALVK
jgi:ATP-dependent Lon protease